jgi:hypothetical protein
MGDNIEEDGGLVVTLQSKLPLRHWQERFFDMEYGIVLRFLKTSHYIDGLYTSMACGSSCFLDLFAAAGAVSSPSITCTSDGAGAPRSSCVDFSSLSPLPCAQWHRRDYDAMKNIHSPPERGRCRITMNRNTKQNCES